MGLEMIVLQEYMHHFFHSLKLRASYITSHAVRLKGPYLTTGISRESRYWEVVAQVMQQESDLTHLLL